MVIKLVQYLALYFFIEYVEGLFLDCVYNIISHYDLAEDNDPYLGQAIDSLSSDYYAYMDNFQWELPFYHYDCASQTGKFIYPVGWKLLHGEC